MARDDQRQGAEDRAAAPGLPRRARPRLRADRRALSAWKVTVRTGPRVERATYADRDQALDAIQARAQQVARAAPGSGVDLKYRRYDPEQLISARIELAGPERLLPSIRAGLDVRGDGSTEAFVGRVRRRVIEPRRGENPAQALRRMLDERA